MRGAVAELPHIDSTALSKPSRIRVSDSDGSYLVEDEDRAEILVYASDLSPRGLTRIQRKSTGAGQLMAVYDWAPVGNGLLAFGDLQEPETKRWESAFLYFDDEGGRALYRLSTESAKRIYYQRNLPYVAASEDAGYILFLEEDTRVLEARADVDAGLRELELFPEDFRKAPPLRRIPGFHGTLEATAFYKLVERSTMAAGIFTWEDQLFLLAKKAMDKNGNTAWCLIRIDPADGKELSRTRLPTQAAHLTVVPGVFWALIEKDPVTPQGQSGSPYMEIRTMTLMPGGWLSDSPSQTSVAACVPIF